MLVWKPGNFKILIVGSQVDAIPIVERRIGKVISLPIDIHILSPEKLNLDKAIIPSVDLILVDKVHEKQFRSYYQDRIFSSKDFIPSLTFHLKHNDSGSEIEFLQ